jgi:DNA modification methylase
MRAFYDTCLPRLSDSKSKNFTRIKFDNAILYTANALTALKRLPSASIQSCVTGPPCFRLRDFGGMSEQIGLEKSPKEYIEKLISVFEEVRRVLKDDGTLWINIADNYARSSDEKLTDSRLKTKDLIGIPWMLAFALRDAGWYLRQDIIWSKRNPMPESVRDRCTKSHEYMFLLTKSARYFFNVDAIKEQAVGGASGNSERKLRPSSDVLRRGNQAGGIPWTGSEFRQKRDVWTTTVSCRKGVHHAVYPRSLIEPCVLASSSEDDIILDPFNGSGTTGIVALDYGRKYIGIELNPKYIELTKERLNLSLT